MAIRSSLLAALGAKAVAGGAVAALAAGGAVAATAATGSANPLNWGQRVVQQVEGCKDKVRGEQPTTPASAPRGIGECVSDFAQGHGAQQRAAHESTGGPPSPMPGKREGQEGGSSTGGNGHGAGAQGAGKPATAPQGGAPGSSGGAGQSGGHSQGDGHGRPTPTPTT